MALINYRGVFPVLNNSTRITITLPDINPEDGTKWPVLWLLGEEGMSSDYYVRKCDIESLSRRYNIVIVMPEGLHSDYENMLRGLKWFDYVSDALPKFFYDNFPISDRKEDNYVFGFGMGGLGAFRLALRLPDMDDAFGCCGTDFDVFVDDEFHSAEGYVHKMKTIYGDDYFSEPVLETSDPYRMVEKAEYIPRLIVYGDDEATVRIQKMLAKQPTGTFLANELDLGDYSAVLDSFLTFATRT